MQSFIGTDMAFYCLCWSVLLRTLSVCVMLLSICILHYILRLDVFIGILLCFYSLFNQPRNYTFTTYIQQ